MSKMIEKVAEAIWYENYGRHRPEGKNKWPDDVVGGSQDLFRSAARAAIEAMREPTAEMIEAGEWRSDGECAVREAWDEMIDTALSVEPAKAAVLAE